MPTMLRGSAQTRDRSTATTRPQGRIDGLDGLRAISILIVLIGHGAHTVGVPVFMQTFSEMGIVGVELFFTISGFIITHLLLRERARDGNIDLRKFWWRRALRIVPPFAAAALGIAIAAAAGIIQWHWTSFIGAVTLTKDTTLLPGDWFFGHIWSLSLEEQFYLLWPLVFAFALNTQRTMWLLLALVIGNALITPLVWHVARPFENTLPYIPHLAAGCLLAMALHAPQPPRWLQAWRALPMRGVLITTLAALALIVSWLRGRDQMDFTWVPLYAVLVPITAMLIVAEIALPEGSLRTVLATPALRWFGRISYSLYLWQQLFFGPADAYPHPWLWATWPYNIVAAVACGALGYYLIEKPAARLKQHFERHDASTSARVRTNTLPRCRADTTSKTRNFGPLR
ncbi:acyltransferase family protein [Solimonas marina]|uniref:Acyltransferase n=1 Tax=Solimonas marina TaxID=2714601 RepID=A0A970BA27_9GAMM|nr:acyltransferase [Solimonas marina]NKF22956.1 acyltransferase [Solimonas marina]